MSQLEARLKETAERINIALNSLLPAEQGSEAGLLGAVRYAALGGGKRFRPFFTLEAGRIFDADEGFLLRAACAIELVHTYSLVHDDLPAMDDDDLRRGRRGQGRGRRPGSSLHLGRRALSGASTGLIVFERYRGPRAEEGRVLAGCDRPRVAPSSSPRTAGEIDAGEDEEERGRPSPPEGPVRPGRRRAAPWVRKSTAARVGSQERRAEASPSGRR